MSSFWNEPEPGEPTRSRSLPGAMGGPGPTLRLVDVFDCYRDALGIEGCERLVDTVRMATTLGTTPAILAELVLDAHRRLGREPGDLFGHAVLDCAVIVAKGIEGRAALPTATRTVYDGEQPGPPVPGSPDQAPPPVADPDLPPAA